MSRIRNVENFVQHFISPKNTAILQAMGIDVYESIESINVQDVPWITEVCELLKITDKDVLFEASNISFDKEKQVLYLPTNFYGTDVELKKSIWHKIQPFVCFDGQ